MSYTPINANAFIAAYSGALAGMAVGSWITSGTQANYALVASIAGAFAQQFDTAWNDAEPIDTLEDKCITTTCQNQFAGRQPGSLNNEAFTDPDTWSVSAAACAALVLEAEAYFAGQSITPVRAPTPALKNVLIVDPSNAAAYQTVQSAIDAAVANEVAGLGPDWVIMIAPKTAAYYVEDLVFPAAGLNMKLLGTGANYFDVGIIGEHTWNPTGSNSLELDGIYFGGVDPANETVLGGNCTGSADLILGQCGFDAHIAFTGNVGIYGNGGGQLNSGYQAYCEGIETDGRISLQNWGLYDDYNKGFYGGLEVILDNCRIQTANDITTSSATIRLISCTFTNSLAPTFEFDTIEGTVKTDAYTLSGILGVGADATQGTFETQNGSKVIHYRDGDDNITAHTIIANAAPGLYQVSVYIRYLSNGTTGTLVPKINYPGTSGGTAVSIGAGADISTAYDYQASRVFYSGGQFSVSVTGVVTPGALNYEITWVVLNLGDVNSVVAP